MTPMARRKIKRDTFKRAEAFPKREPEFILEDGQDIVIPDGAKFVIQDGEIVYNADAGEEDSQDDGNVYYIVGE